MFTKPVLFFVALSLLTFLPDRTVSVGVIRGFVQTNIVGLPLIHKIESYPIDPYISQRRRRQFEELHGFRGEKLIERLGLGIDGKDQERLKMQQERDEGHLNGLNYKLP